MDHRRETKADLENEVKQAVLKEANSFDEKITKKVKTETIKKFKRNLTLLREKFKVDMLWIHEGIREKIGDKPVNCVTGHILSLIFKQLQNHKIFKLSKFSTQLEIVFFNETSKMINFTK